MTSTDVAIIGAGLTGLRLAQVLQNARIPHLVLERSGTVGGRVSTSLKNGYRIDHGFQIFLSSYPELHAAIGDFESLKPRYFLSGARIQHGRQLHTLLNPLRHPLSLIETLRRPLCTRKDFLALLRLYLSSLSAHPTSTGVSTDHYLSQLRFSDNFRNSFLDPFFRGVLLDDNLQVDHSLTRFLIRMFSHGRAALFEDGARALPIRMARTLSAETLRLGCNVTGFSRELSGGRAFLIKTESGAEVRARKIAFATSLPMEHSILRSTAAGVALEREMRSFLSADPKFFPSHTFYLSAENAPYQEPILTLNGNPLGCLNHMAVLTNVQPSYAPEGRVLIAVCTRSRDCVPNVDDVLTELRDWYGDQVLEWELEDIQSIPQALPARTAFAQGFCALTGEHEGIYCAGDWLSYASQNGALMAGRLCGEEIIRSAKTECS